MIRVPKKQVGMTLEEYERWKSDRMALMSRVARYKDIDELRRQRIDEGHYIVPLSVVNLEPNTCAKCGISIKEWVSYVSHVYVIKNAIAKTCIKFCDDICADLFEPSNLGLSDYVSGFIHMGPHGKTARGDDVGELLSDRFRHSKKWLGA